MLFIVVHRPVCSFVAVRTPRDRKGASFTGPVYCKMITYLSNLEFNVDGRISPQWNTSWREWCRISWRWSIHHLLKNGKQRWILMENLASFDSDLSNTSPLSVFSLTYLLILRRLFILLPVGQQVFSVNYEYLLPYRRTIYLSMCCHVTGMAVLQAWRPSQLSSLSPCIQLGSSSSSLVWFLSIPASRFAHLLPSILL